MLRACAVIVLAGCGRIGFDPALGAGGADAGSDSDAAMLGGDAPPAMIAHVGVFVARGGGSANDSFTAQAHAAGNAIVMQVACAANAVPSAVSVTAPGWAWIQLGPITAVSGAVERAATIVAIAPNAEPATISVTWTGSTCNSSVNDVGDEFAMTDPAGGAITFDAAKQTQGQGACSGTITTGHASDVVWGACDSSSSVSSLGTGYTLGANDTAGDWSEYKVTSDAPGTAETVSFGNGNNFFVLSMVTLKPM